jgi:hypothetical protein
MDFGVSIGTIPEEIDPTETEVDPGRTRHIIAVEALTGSFQGYFPIQLPRPADPTGRDASLPFPHTTWPDPAVYPDVRQRSDGLLDAYFDGLYFGFATFDALESAEEGVAGDFSYGSTTNGVNLGIVNYAGGLIPPLPAGGAFPGVPGATFAFRSAINGQVQRSFMEMIPALGTPLAASIDDMDYFVHNDPSLVLDPYAACRPIAQVLITDGIGSWDACYSASPPDNLDCLNYWYDPSYIESLELGYGNCEHCVEGQTAVPVPTHVIAFGIAETNSADLIAENGGTCAIFDSSANACVQPAYRAENHASLVASLGTAFNNALGSVTRSIPPLTSTVIGVGRIGVVRFRAGALVDTHSPYWYGTLQREVFECLAPEDDPDGPIELRRSEISDFANWFTPDNLDSRRILVGHPALASSCDASRRDCDFFDPTCGDPVSAVPDPLHGTFSGYGDGTGGPTSGGATLAEPTPDATSRAEIDANLRELRRLANRHGNDDPLPERVDGFFDAIDAADLSTDCLIDFDLDTFVRDQDLSDLLYAEDVWEAGRIVSFVRGHQLQDLLDADLNEDGIVDDTALLGGLFNADLLSLHDRVTQQRVVGDITIPAGSGYVGDFFHSNMAFLSPPSPIERTSPGFTAFVDQLGVGSEDPRPWAVFIGGNDGMLHAFDAFTGEELWAIIPPSFLPQLGRLLFSHQIMLDGPVAARDLRCVHNAEAEEWCSIAAVTYRGGGSGVMVLDVTDPREPKFLWELTGQDVPELGLGYTRPLLGNMFINGEERPVVVLAGGRPLDGPIVTIGSEDFGSHEGEILLVMDAVTGQIYRQFDPVSHPELFRSCGPITGSPSGWNRTLFTRVFAGTQQGCMLRFDLSSDDPADWRAEVLDKPLRPGMIHFPPALATRPDGSLVVVYGQGSTEEFENLQVLSSVVSVNEGRGLGFDCVGGSVVSDNSGEPEGSLQRFVLCQDAASRSNVNYELALEQGEFLTTAPIISDGVVYMASFEADTVTPCDFGNARLYGIDYLGNPEVSGSDGGTPYFVEIDSDRITPRFRNPDPESDVERVKYIGASILGKPSVILALNIEPVPTCDTIDVPIRRAGEDGESVQTVIAGSTERQLRVELTQAEELVNLGATGWADQQEGGTVFTSRNVGFEMEQAGVTAVPLDWGVIVEY